MLTLSLSLSLSASLQSAFLLVSAYVRSLRSTLFLLPLGASRVLTSVHFDSLLLRASSGFRSEHMQADIIRKRERESRRKESWREACEQ